MPPVTMASLWGSKCTGQSVGNKGAHSNWVSIWRRPGPSQHSSTWAQPPHSAPPIPTIGILAPPSPFACNTPRSSEMNVAPWIRWRIELMNTVESWSVEMISVQIHFYLLSPISSTFIHYHPPLSIFMHCKTCYVILDYLRQFSTIFEHFIKFKLVFGNSRQY